MIAIDPGAAHCGVSRFDKGKLAWTGTMRPNELFTLLEETPHRLWVYEEWRTYPWATKAFDPVLTAEAIGVIKYIGRKRARILVPQPAMIKKPTAGHLRSMGIELMPGTIHAQDSQLHGYHYLLKGAKNG